MCVYVCYPSVLLNLLKHGMLLLSLPLLFLKRPYCRSCFIVLGQVFGSKCGDFGGFSSASGSTMDYLSRFDSINVKFGNTFSPFKSQK